MFSPPQKNQITMNPTLSIISIKNVVIPRAIVMVGQFPTPVEFIHESGIIRERCPWLPSSLKYT